MSDTILRPPSSASSRRLWFGLLAAMSAWIVHGIGSFIIASAACSGGNVAEWSGLSHAGLRGLLIALTVAALMVAVSGGVVAWSTWRRLATARFNRTQAWGRGEFMALAGVFISTIFSIGIVWGGLAPILTGLCEAGR
jgi:hypothetical protein